MTTSAKHVTDHLSEWLDGELDERAAEAVRVHVDACDACREAADTMRAMVGAARALGRDRPEPPPALWPAIAGEIERGESLMSRFRPYLVGAFAGAAAVLLVTAAPWRPVRHRDAGANLVAQAGKPVDPLLAEAEAELEHAADRYEASILKLRDLLTREQQRWSTEARARMTERLARMDDAIERSRDAARRAPGDVAGSEILFAAYRKKIDFLTDAVHRGSPGEEGASWR